MCSLRFENNLLTIEENTIIEAFVRFRFANVAITNQDSSGCYSSDLQGGVKSLPPKTCPNLHHNTTQQYGPWILLIYIYIKLPIDH